MNTIRHYADFDLRGSLIYGKQVNQFPASPRVNEQVLKDGVLWIWATIEGLNTWYPLTNKKMSYVHTQGAPAASWTINHGYNSTNFVFAVYDENGAMVNPSGISSVQNNSFVVDFGGEPSLGRVVVFFESEMFTPALTTAAINAETLNIANGTVTAGPTGLFVNGIPVSVAGHVHAISDVTGLQGALDAKADTSSLATVATSGSYEDLSNKPKLSDLGGVPSNTVGQANGVASLDSNGLIPSAQIPGGVDEVQEYPDFASLPVVGQAATIYITTDTDPVKQWRWSGSAYAEMVASPGSTDAVPEGSLNLYHTTLRASAAAPVQTVAGRTGNVVLVAADIADLPASGPAEAGTLTGTELASNVLTSSLTSVGVLASLEVSGNLQVDTAVVGQNNASGIGVPLKIKGSTGTGQAGNSGGNGYVEIIGGGGTSQWTGFHQPWQRRRRGGINLQAGLASGDASGTYFNGSNIDIYGSDGTTNGSSVGVGSSVSISGGSGITATGLLNTGSALFIAGGTSYNAGNATLAGGNAAAGSNAFGGNVFITAGAGDGTGTSGNVIIQAGSGAASGVPGSLDLRGGNGGSTSSGGAVSISPYGSETFRVVSSGAWSLGNSGINFGTAGQALTSSGAGASPEWSTVVSPGVATAFTAQQYFAEATLTDAPTIAWNLAVAQVAKVTLTTSRTIGAPTNMQPGGFYSICIIQPLAGNCTGTWDSVFKFPNGSAPILSTGANAKDFFTFRSDGTNMYEQTRSQAVA